MTYDETTLNFANSGANVLKYHRSLDCNRRTLVEHEQEIERKKGRQEGRTDGRKDGRKQEKHCWKSLSNSFRAWIGSAILAQVRADGCFGRRGSGSRGRRRLPQQPARIEQQAVGTLVGQLHINSIFLHVHTCTYMYILLHVIWNLHVTLNDSFSAVSKTILQVNTKC